jgi:hypothetical protein
MNRTDDSTIDSITTYNKAKFIVELRYNRHDRSLQNDSCDDYSGIYMINDDDGYYYPIKDDVVEND